MTLATFIQKLLPTSESRDSLPVFARSPSRGPLYLGQAVTHRQAEALGLLAGMTCERVSRGRLPGDDRTFFVLH